MISSSSTVLILALVVLVLLPSQTYAFGAGEIPDFAYLNNKAFRHGDLENVLAELAKSAGGVAAGGGLFGMAQSFLGAAGGGGKFSSSDVKKVYFGNWLRDYSQAMDIAGLSKLTADTLILIVSILGFLTFGFATEEFQVTADRLGVYLPVEHIDNPKGYAEQEGDARQFHPKLRPPVNPEELEIDPRTGMKNYMATENRGWDTSTAHIRRTFAACIEHGRRARGREGADLWEAYRLLGTGLHTMEDLLAHSNWCEITLRKMGYNQVFCHVGDNVLINTPSGEAPPLVTGTFGSADFLHSLMGEATDHLSQASVTDLSQNLANASQNDTDSSLLRSLLKKLPLGGSDDADKVSQADAMKEKAKAYQFNPDNVMPPEVQAQLLALLKWRDGIYRDILSKIEMIPGLEGLIDSLTNALNAFVYTILAPYLTPVLQQVTSVLSEGSKAVIDSEDQYEVFDNADASDPSHSLLSKDHFALILNEPAGKTAQVVVRYSVKLIVDAWYNNEDPNRVIDEILEAFHHPYFNTGRSRIQEDMFDEMKRWINNLDREESERIIAALTKESVRAGKNKRQGSDDDMSSSTQVYGQVHGQAAQGGYSQGGYSSGTTDESRPAKQQYSSDGYGGSKQQYGSNEDKYSSGGGYQSSNKYNDSESQGYGRSEDTYGSRRHKSSYEDEPTEGSSYNRQQSYGEEQPSSRRYGGEDPISESRDDTYGSSRRTQESSYSREESTGYSFRYGEQKTESSGYTPAYQPAYDRPSEGYSESRSEGYGGLRGGGYGQDEYRSQESRGGYGRSEETSGYGRREEESGGYGRREEESSGYGGYSVKRTEYTQEEPSYGGASAYRREEGGHADFDGGSRGYGCPPPQLEEDTYGSRGYGRPPPPPEEETYGSTGYGGGGYGQSEYRGVSGGYGDSEPSGYNPGYGGAYGGGESRGGYGGGESGGGYGGAESRGGYGGADETFGAERLNINEEAEERPHHGRHHHHKHHHEDE